MDVIYFLRSICKNTSVYILKPCWEIGQSFEESLRAGKLVEDYKIFWMNNKTINIIEFGFLSMWRIMQNLVDVIHLTLLDVHKSSHTTKPHSIITTYTCIMPSSTFPNITLSKIPLCCQPFMLLVVMVNGNTPWHPSD